MLTVQAQALQVSAPSGVASRGMTTGGMFYRLMDQGTGYLQLKLVGNAPERVMVSASQVQTELSIISSGSTPTKAWQPAGQMGGLSAWVPTAAALRRRTVVLPVCICVFVWVSVGRRGEGRRQKGNRRW